MQLHLRQISEFKTSLVHKASLKKVRTTHRNSVSRETEREREETKGANSQRRLKGEIHSPLLLV